MTDDCPIPGWDGDTIVVTSHCPDVGTPPVEPPQPAEARTDISEARQTHTAPDTDGMVSTDTA
jgi:hypothetical protein